MEAYLVQREALSEGELVEVSYRDLQRDPMGTLGTIFDRIKIDGYDAAAPIFRSYIDGQRDYRKNTLSLSAEERWQVGHCWGGVFDRLGYSV